MGRIVGDLNERTTRFALAVLDAIDRLPTGNKGWELGRQLIRSGTSVGANIREADNALTDADFAHKCSIARKEASEAYYWLDLCRRSGMLVERETDDLLREADELARVLSTIVRRTQGYIQRRKQSGAGGDSVGTKSKAPTYSTP